MFEKIIEKFFEAPAVALEEALTASSRVSKKFKNGKAEEYWKMLGPGLTTGAADDDPAGIATYSQTGAQFGFKFLWTASFSFPLMAIVQEMCARIGLVTGQGLAANIKDYYPRWVLYLCTTLLFAANTFNIGADLGAMAGAAELVTRNIPSWFLILIFALVSLLLQIFTTYERYARYLKLLALILVSYVFSALLVHLDWGVLWHNTFIPHLSFSKSELFILAAVLGTTISPYLFFWQTSQEVEEEILVGRDTLESRRGSTNEEVRKMRIDVWSGMFLSNFIMFFIIAASAATLFQAHLFTIKTAADAAEALRPLAGQGAFLLFTLGIIGTGLLAVPVLAGSASYALSESFGWPGGLYRKLKEASAFYGVIIISMLIGFLLNFIGLDPIKALIYSAVANALISPIVLVLIVRISARKDIMGEWTNRPFTSLIGWLIVLLMLFVSIGAMVSLF